LDFQKPEDLNSSAIVIADRMASLEVYYCNSCRRGVLTVLASAAANAPRPALSPEQEDRIKQIAKLDLNNTNAQQKYLEAINESNLTKKIELMKEANMYENGTWAETCRLYQELNC
jgi:hypothetical protein